MAPRVPSAHDVAALIIQEQHTANRTVDKLQLEKWLYLVLGAHYVMWGQKAFREPAAAFARGPVIRNVEATYRSIPTREIPAPLGGRPERVPSNLVETVRLVLHHFGKWSGPDLETFTKQGGAPWTLTVQNRDIEGSLIETWFRRHGVDPAPRDRVSDSELVDRLADGDEKALAELLR